MRRFFVPKVSINARTRWSAPSSTAITAPEKPFSATRGGMLSGRAGRRKCDHTQLHCQCPPETSARARDIHRASVIRMTSIYIASTKRHPREGTAACPYEWLYQVRFAIGKLQSTVINKPISAPRGGMLSGRAGRRKCVHTAVLELVNTGDFGASARHPPSKRESTIPVPRH